MKGVYSYINIETRYDLWRQVVAYIGEEVQEALRDSLWDDPSSQMASFAEDTYFLFDNIFDEELWQ